MSCDASYIFMQCSIYTMKASSFLQTIFPNSISGNSSIVWIWRSVKYRFLGVLRMFSPFCKEYKSNTDKDYLLITSTSTSSYCRHHRQRAVSLCSRILKKQCTISNVRNKCIYHPSFHMTLRKFSWTTSICHDVKRSYVVYKLTPLFLDPYINIPVMLSRKMRKR